MFCKNPLKRQPIIRDDAWPVVETRGPVAGVSFSKVLPRSIAFRLRSTAPRDEKYALSNTDERGGDRRTSTNPDNNVDVITERANPLSARHATR